MPGAECVKLIDSPEIPNQDTELQIAEESTPPSSFESPSRSCTVKTLEASEISTDIPERPSPVSVLEPLFMEEDIRPAKTGSLSDDPSIEPLKINFKDEDGIACPEESAEEEGLLLYITSIMPACGFNWTELYLKSKLSDQLLEPSLYGDVGFFCDHPQLDQNLVLDCINEALLKVIDRYFQLCPRVSSTKAMIRAIPSLKDAILEVWERVNCHLLGSMPLPPTLDQVVRKDMARNESWMELRPDTEGLVFDMGGDILDDLTEEFADETLQNLHASSSMEIIENEDNIG
ncbi:hypothetical protein SAY87_012788 [Trapa incisa]|uniref:DUF4378 domain-containing protein n=1 Tax=Trapa incisa TaxID=236973 RepID=A0AAN7GLL0_9MYRT|nr:hypothetical protein SAY87_012788 [Trapa incisa]